MVSAVARRPSTLLENLQVIALGATAGIVVGGSVFVMPAIFVLGLEDRTSFFQKIVDAIFDTLEVRRAQVMLLAEETGEVTSGPPWAPWTSWKSSRT